jgi:serine/threonine protein phosphatase 1
MNFDELRVRGSRPTLAAGARIYAVGDIHGRADLLDPLFAQVDADIAKRPITRPIYVFLGDYIDRGSGSRETIDRLILHSEDSECVFLKGNHESIALKCLTDPTLLDQWLRLGGVETLLSYGVSPDIVARGRSAIELQAAYHQSLPQAHFRFFRDLQNSFSCGDFFFAHAGVRPNVGLPQQKESDLLWIRDEFLASSIDFGKIIVHGHTPVHEIEIRPNRINLDTGAYATGRLTCLAIDNTSLSVIETSGGG